MQNNLFALMHQLNNSASPFAVATVIEVQGSASAKIGSKAVIDSTGAMLSGWIGGGCAESQCCEAACQAIHEKSSTIIDIDLDDEVLGAGMPCGGSMRVFIDPVIPSPTIWIIGHGRIAESLCHQAKELSFRVIINDPSALRTKFPAADQLINDDLNYSLVQPSTSDFVVIATQHKGDHDCLRQVLQSNAKYIGLIASQKRAKLVLEYFIKNKLPDVQLARIRTPCGINLGAKTPEEIAQSVLAEITLIRRQGTGLLMHQNTETYSEHE